MARTFIGELILRMKDTASSQAQTAAGKMESSMDRINRAAKRLGDAPWGGRFQSQLDKLGASAKDLDHLRTSWDRLQASFQKDNLSKAMQRTQVANWKTAATGHFAAIAAGAREAEKAQRKYRDTVKDMMRLGIYSVGAGSLAYFTGRGVRGGVAASAEWEREKFRQEMANIPEGERDQILDRSEQLGAQYPSVSIADIAEMGRKARSMMGTTERGLAILDDMVRGMVALQSAKGLDAATSELERLLKGIDNAGKNDEGQVGIDDTREIIAGYIRAAQVEGSDLDAGKFWDFARRGKIAVPGLTTRFIATTVPALSQDLGADQFGTALSSAFQAFVIGANSNSSKVNIEAQHDLGIRTGPGKGKLVRDDLFVANPYAWAKEVLIPALQKNGVDTNDKGETSQAIALLTKNTNAARLLTNLISQQPQIDRLVEQYNAAMGPEAADEAQFKDPFVSARGFVESLRNLASAVGEDVMPTAVRGLNSLTGAINNLQQSWRDGDPMAKVGITAGAGITGLLAWKGLAAIWGLATAGPALNSAAGALHLAAASLSGAGAAGKAGATAAGGSGVAGWAGARAAAIGTGLLAAWGTLVQSLGDTPGDTFEDQVRNQQRYKEDLQRVVSSFLGDGKPDVSKNEDVMAGQRAASDGGNPLQNAVDNATRLGGGPVLDTTSLEEARQKAAEAEQAILSAASVSGTPVIDTSNLERALSVAKEFKATLRELMADANSVTAPSGNSVSRQMQRNMTDQGVVP